MQRTAGVLAGLLCAGLAFAAEPEQKTDALEKFSGIAWGASIAEAQALHPEMRCQKSSSEIEGGTTCDLGPTEKEMEEAVKRFKQEMKAWSRGGKKPDLPTRHGPLIGLVFRDDKLITGTVIFMEEQYADYVKCSTWSAVRGAMIEKYGEPTSQDTEAQYDEVNEEAVNRERLFWRGGSAVASLFQFQEHTSLCPMLAMMATAAIERQLKKTEEEKKKVKEKF